MVARAVGSCGGNNGRTEASSRSGEPVVSAVFPKSSREAVGHEYRRNPFRILKSELGRSAQLERIAIAPQSHTSLDQEVTPLESGAGTHVNDLTKAQDLCVPENRALAPYIAGSLGTLIGADLTNLDKVRGLGAPVASIGGAGTFDGIFLTGILAVLLASLYARPRAARVG